MTRLTLNQLDRNGSTPIEIDRRDIVGAEHVATRFAEIIEGHPTSYTRLDLFDGTFVFVAESPGEIARLSKNKGATS